MDDGKGLTEATFAAGCFWHVEDAFMQTKGVVMTEVGFMGGTTSNPSYKQVCTKTTGHAEVVHLLYDPKVVSYEHLLDVFWSIHDPTQVNRQGPDVGDQYRTGIFYYTEEQRAQAEASKDRLQSSGKFKRPIATEITKASTFWKAEEYHQKYFQKHGISHCPV
ncbi:MAG: peptide-methionine (S)-S-oxide reductase MsrA [Methanomassiliicoccales archaeon]|nr:peptide-methionine (S)-S-oxide reductase MsrA [Methanomassiliicoccales archaeon]MDD1756703.1 peptide-methionine (S)-S-oxide reductase MsrA [Methanomassiliicoccales archaeon]